jgi:hypothetical protein
MQKAGDVVQLVRTLPCHGRGREFESRRPRQLFQTTYKFHLKRSGSNQGPSDYRTEGRIYSLPRFRSAEWPLPACSERDFACCRRLKKLVCDAQIRVPQIVTDRELVLSHFGEDAQNRVSESMPNPITLSSPKHGLPMSPVSQINALRTEVSDTRVDGALAPEYCCCRRQSDQY